MARVRSSTCRQAKDIDRLIINPSLQIIPTVWHGLTGLLDPEAEIWQQPEPGEELVLVWKSPHDHRTYSEAALPSDLAAVKIIVEDRDRYAAAREADVPVGCIDKVIRQAVSKGLLLSPPSRIRRPKSYRSIDSAEKTLSATVFTLQWHITGECDLNCLHCYDRSGRRSVDSTEGLAYSRPDAGFLPKPLCPGTGVFFRRQPPAASRFSAAVPRRCRTWSCHGDPGKPHNSRQLSEIVAVQMPSYFQVSLEGLEEHNDRIRGSRTFPENH